MQDRFDSQFPPGRGRAHEVMGPGATAFAAIAAGQVGGPVLWLVEGWRNDRVNPMGLARFCDPSAILVAEAADHRQVLALAEEGLRDGSARTVVAELHEPLDLTAGRRLQLAAEAGGALGIFLIPMEKGSNAAETRWLCTPEFDAADSTRMRWQITKNKSGTLCAWTLTWNEQTHRLSVVSETRL